jgi:hypothetical protein
MTNQTEEKTDKMKCKNCGHEVAVFDGKVYHVGRDRDNGDVELTKNCIPLNTKESRKFLNEQLTLLDKKMLEKFGDQYYTETWFFNIHCKCRNPELEIKI